MYPGRFIKRDHEFQGCLNSDGFCYKKVTLRIIIKMVDSKCWEVLGDEQMNNTEWGINKGSAYI